MASVQKKWIGSFAGVKPISLCMGVKPWAAGHILPHSVVTFGLRSQYKSTTGAAGPLVTYSTCTATLFIEGCYYYLIGLLLVFYFQVIISLWKKKKKKISAKTKRRIRNIDENAGRKYKASQQPLGFFKHLVPSMHFSPSSPRRFEKLRSEQINACVMLLNQYLWDRFINDCVLK